MAIKVLFIPGNPSHVKSQLPIAEELRCRGHLPAFLIRDDVVHPEYQTRKYIDSTLYPLYIYSDYYESDIQRKLPRLIPYFNSKRSVYNFLRSIDFDITVSCNDTSALFDRLAVEFSRINRKLSILIQESVRPNLRKLPFYHHPWRQTCSAFSDTIVDFFVQHLTTGAFARYKYGHSRCSLIATAGDRFRRQLIQQNIDPMKIRVTGQPRLDSHIDNIKTDVIEKSANEPKVLLYCNQPLPCGQPPLDCFFRELIDTCDTMNDVRLLVKLHPRDIPENHWKSIISPQAGRCLMDITRTRPLSECLQIADGMITIASTTSLEAMMAGVPVALVNYLPTTWYLPYDELGAAISIASANELPHAIRKLLFDIDQRNIMQLAAKDVLYDELYLCDGKSAYRIADLMEELVLGKVNL